MRSFAKKSQNGTPRVVPNQYLPLTRFLFPEKITLGYSPWSNFLWSARKCLSPNLFSRGIFFFSKYHVGVLKRVFHYVTRKRFLVENFLSATFLIS